MKTNINVSELKKIINEQIDNEIYDFADGISEKKRNACVDALAKVVIALLDDYKVYAIDINGHKLKVHNERQSWLSLSDDYTTSVARSCYYIFDDDTKNDPTDIKDNITTLLDMYNEAYYRLMNDEI